MRHSPILRSGLIVPVLLTLSLGSSPIAQAHEALHHLRGDYAFTGTVICAADPVGFSSNLSHLGTGHSNGFSVAGTVHYNGDGTGSVTQQTLRVNLSAISSPPIPVEQINHICDLTYTVNDDHSFTEQLTCSGTTLIGFGFPSTSTFAFQLKGIIAQGGDTLLLSDTSPNDEIVTRVPGPPTTLHQICGRSLTAVRVKNN